jgi:hypothetical protein
MPTSRRTLLAAAALLLAAPAHASPFFPVPVGASTLAAWSYMGPRVCAEGPDPTYTSNQGVPWVEIACLTYFDAWAYRALGGGYFLRAASDLPFVDTYLYVGNLYYDDDRFGTDVTDWPYDYQFGMYRDNMTGDPATWLAAEGAKPQGVAASYDYVRFVIDGSGSPENPFPEYSYASFGNQVVLQPVAIRAVPEPATLALVATGVLLVGAVARCRRA